MSGQERSICFVAPQAGAFLGGLPGAGGAERQLVLFGAVLRDRGWDVSFVVDRIPQERIPEARDFRVFAAPMTYMGGSKKAVLRDWWRLRSVVREAGSRYVLLKTPGHLLLPLLFSLRQEQGLVFFGQTTRRSMPGAPWPVRLVDAIEERCLSSCEVVLAQSAEQAARYAPFCKRPPVIVPSIIAASSQPATERDIDVLWAGNATPNKRFDLLLETARLLPHVRFSVAMIACRGMPTEPFRARAASVPNLDFLGAVPPPDMDMLYARSRLLCCTSDVEGFPNAFLQAFQMGAVVFSRRIDPDGILAREHMGVCLGLPTGAAEGPVGDQARLLADGMARLLADGASLAAMQARAHAYVMAHHAPEVACKRLEEALLRSCDS